jgi:hypothetical protein
MKRTSMQNSEFHEMFVDIAFAVFCRMEQQLEQKVAVQEILLDLVVSWNTSLSICLH